MFTINTIQITKTVRCILDVSSYYNDGETHYQEVQDHIQPGYDWNRIFLDDYLKPIKKLKDPILLKIKEDLDNAYPAGSLPEQV
jgi:hypothetical protein